MVETHSDHPTTDTKEAVESAILDLLQARRPEASICPSEAARAVFGEQWREQMPEVRAVASAMAVQGQIEICQKGLVVDSATVKGPVRFRIHQDSIS